MMKQRINSNTNKPVGESTANDPKPLPTGGPPAAQNRSNTSCGDCFGAGAAGQCCETCSDVMYAYRSRRWAAPRPEQIPQCANMTSPDRMYQPPQFIHVEAFNASHFQSRLTLLEPLTKDAKAKDQDTPSGGSVFGPLPPLSIEFAGRSYNDPLTLDGWDDEDSYSAS